MALTIGTISPNQAFGATVAESVRFIASIPITASAIPATTLTSLTGSVPGLTTDMVLTIQCPAMAVNVACVGGRCSATGVLQLDYVNPTDSAVTPTNGTYVIIA